jgi:hypothetical protein
MKRSIEEQAQYMLDKMTVDMNIDFWQSQQCAINACEIIIDEVVETADNELVTPTIIYWEKVKKALQNYKK